MGNLNKKPESIMKLIDKFIWLSIVTIYLFVSFTTGAWHISWLIFLVGALVSTGAEILYRLKFKKNNIDI
ncbi:MAG: hypothetical protein ACRCWM_10595 [Sarcina sp.]